MGDVQNKKNIKIIHSKRKTVAIQIKPDLTIVVRVPYRFPQKEIDKLLEEKAAWIEKNMKILREQKKEKAELPRYTEKEIKQLFEKAMAHIPKRVRYFSDIIGVDYRRITIRNQKTRWGSCSAMGGLNFNCLLMETPPEVIDYVVVHELCHRKEMNHSERFWKEVETVLPDYKVQVKWLKENGNLLMQRMHG